MNTNKLDGNWTEEDKNECSTMKINITDIYLLPRGTLRITNSIIIK